MSHNLFVKLFGKKTNTCSAGQKVLSLLKKHKTFIKWEYIDQAKKDYLFDNFCGYCIINDCLKIRINCGQIFDSQYNDKQNNAKIIKRLKSSWETYAEPLRLKEEKKKKNLEEQRTLYLKKFKNKCSPQQDFENILWAAFNSFIKYKQMGKLTVYKTETGEESAGSSMYSWHPYWSTFDVIADNIYLFSVHFDFNPHFVQGKNFNYRLGWIEIHCYNPITKTTGIRFDKQNYNIYCNDAEIPMCKLEYELEHNNGTMFGITNYGPFILNCADLATDDSTRSALMFLRNPKSQPNIIYGNNPRFDDCIKNKEKEDIKRIDNPLYKYNAINGVIQQIRTRIM